MLVLTWAARIKSQSWSFKDTVSIGNVAHLRNLLSEIVPPLSGRSSDLPSPRYYPCYGPGYSFLFHTQTNSCLDPDGYDNYQAPMGPDGPLFLRRMWTGGLFDYVGASPALDQVVECVDRVQAVRRMGSSTFVSINRVFSGLEPFLRELRTLVYTNEPYTDTALKATKELEDLGSGATFGTPLNVFKTQFTLEQIMRYNFLTYNLHKIHYDATYCRSQGLRDVVVSGPFMVLVLLHYFTSRFPDLAVRGFRYRNQRSCYINTPVSLRIRGGNGEYDLKIVGDDVLCSGKLTADVSSECP
ncbi:hypothetical protein METBISCDRAFT_16895 [Metschnikowia bicuspidata]|uniref:MaoC-like domain-containing protein n=1 Tax=Metschnikowia bicuspidata TaxID=27322 RepID=A0A4P9ZBH7_9ASCO|nr:hypothetical protein METBISCDRAFT_16895 [Metschnikowia bicuspidata]